MRAPGPISRKRRCQKTPESVQLSVCPSPTRNSSHSTPCEREARGPHVMCRLGVPTVRIGTDPTQAVRSGVREVEIAMACRTSRRPLTIECHPRFANFVISHILAKCPSAGRTNKGLETKRPRRDLHRPHRSKMPITIWFAR